MRKAEPLVTLFVCVHNTCRSQMAAAFYAETAGRTKSISAGLEPKGAVDTKAALVMKEAGIDISGNRPRALTRRLIDRAERVVIVCSGTACPNIGNAVRWEIDDPAGGNLDDYRRCRDLIRNKITEII